MTVLRRLDCVTKPSKEAIIQEAADLNERGVENVDPILKNVSGAPIYNTSEYTFDTLTNSPENLAENLQHYIRQFDPDTEEIIEKFEFDHQIERLNEADLLYKVVTSFAEIDLHPETVPNEEMGYIYEERELLEVAEAYDVYSGKSRAGLAAAALYAATHLTNEGLTQATVSDVAHVSHVTIRNRYQELLDVYEGRG